MDIMQDILSMVRYYRNGSGWVLEIPTTKDVAKYYHINNIRQPPPEPEDPFWQGFSVRLYSLLPKWREAYSLQENASDSFPLTLQEMHRTVSPSTDEATVRSAKGPQVQEHLTRLNIHVEPHPTNPGITVMRGKNALLSFIRRGGSLSAPVEDPPKVSLTKKSTTWTVS